MIERKKKIIAAQNIKIQTLDKQIYELKNSAKAKDCQPELLQSMGKASMEEIKCTESSKKVHMYYFVIKY